MEEDFKDELFIVIETLLKAENLVVKKIYDKDLKCFEYLEYMLQYFKIFQSDKIPRTQSIYETTVEKQNNLLIDLCVEKYKELLYMNKDLITNTGQIPIFHYMSKNEAMLMFKEEKKMGNFSHEIKFKHILSEKIEKIFLEWSDQSEKNLKNIEAEVEKTRLALEEKRKADAEQFENAKKASDEVQRLERLNSENAIKLEKYMREKEVAEIRQKYENNRAAYVEEARKKEIAFRAQIERIVRDQPQSCNIL